MQVNILDLTQTIMNGFFTMVMLVDTSTTDKTFDEVRTVLEDEGKKLSLDIRIQREDIFDAMHRI
jgi:ACT domain-containing protein